MCSVDESTTAGPVNPWALNKSESFSHAGWVLWEMSWSSTVLPLRFILCGSLYEPQRKIYEVRPTKYMFSNSQNTVLALISYGPELGSSLRSVLSFKMHGANPSWWLLPWSSDHRGGKSWSLLLQGKRARIFTKYTTCKSEFPWEKTRHYRHAK